jgi:plasmid stability protein
MPSTLTIRNLDDAVKRRLRAKASQSGRSMEEEARVALAKHVGATPKASLFELLAEPLLEVSPVELEPMPRRTRRSLPGPFAE